MDCYISYSAVHVGFPKLHSVSWSWQYHDVTRNFIKSVAININTFSKVSSQKSSFSFYNVLQNLTLYRMQVGNPRHQTTQGRIIVKPATLANLSTLVQVTACCLTAPSHYLHQCWLTISEILCHSSQGNSYLNIPATSRPHPREDNE